MKDSQGSDPIVIVGGGYTGLSAALDLVNAGHKVIVYEAEPTLGGLAGSFEVSPGYWIERFYHHWFTSDTAILDLVRELGIGERIKQMTSNTGLYFANTIFKLSSPIDLLRFKPIPFIDRIRMGLMAIRARRITDWRALEDETAANWIRRVGGEAAYKVIWQPLLKGKFGPETENVSAVWFWNKLKLRGSSRNSKGSESLVYIDGGFLKVTEALEKTLREKGVQIHTSTPVLEILSESGAVRGVRTAEGVQNCSAALVTTPLPTFLQMTPSLPEEFRKTSEKIRFLGNVCLVLRLKKSFSNTYWLNVADPNFPYVGVIEHTNFDPPENYGGEKIAYLSKYLPTTDPMYSMSEAELFEYSVPHIKRMFPEFDPATWVIGYRAWKAHYSQPVITERYSSLIPNPETPIKNLWLSTMAQIYPEDRGTNYAVQHGRKTARAMIDRLRA